jgi:hypothetical protein
MTSQSAVRWGERWLYSDPVWLVEHLVAFSCKRRGFCTSCGARRMPESAVLSIAVEIPVRQPPAPDGPDAGDRMPCHLGPADPKSGVYPKERTDRCGDSDPAIWPCVEPQCALSWCTSLCATLRSCKSAFLPICHMLFLDGVYTTRPWGKSRIHRANAPNHQE